MTSDPAQDADEYTHHNDIAASSVAPAATPAAPPPRTTSSPTSVASPSTPERRSPLLHHRRRRRGRRRAPHGQGVALPQSSVPANEMIITDSTSEWYDAMRPTRIASTPVPTNATLTVQYLAGGVWIDVPNMVDLPGGVHSIAFPDDVRASALGIRFVYTSEEGFVPDSSLAPNLGFELKNPSPRRPGSRTAP
ncbi:hypothetical protein G7085_16385 [Tessaracoccus sp. HDW20]|uniref:hypothetical protein n=1 Tax=Tessaracoccus coleopterorum TaxID=2714950 RepID=UPI0018D277A1|nr:hypothetical protein [Tessaracoccus coleopterorum]NHB85640.1 hypothetical protein [Tessaracoccus coleopterorum]